MTVRIGAHHADAWSGLVLSHRPGEGFGLRVAVERGGPSGPSGPEVLDLDDFFWLVHEVGPHDPEGRYARVSFDLELPWARGADTPVAPKEARQPGLILEWGRVGERVVVGRVRTGFEAVLLLRGYFPWDWVGRWAAAADGSLTGTSATGESAVVVRATASGTPGPRGKELGVGAADRGTADECPGEGALAGWEIDDDGSSPVRRASVLPGAELVFIAAIAGDPAAASQHAYAVDQRAVAGTLREAAAAYETERTRVAGGLEGLAAAVTDNLHWTVLLQPETGRTYTPAGRRWIFPRAEERGGGRDHWTVFGWDSYFNALELDVEAPAAARETLLAGLRTAYPNGCVPNWRGRYGGTPDRSQPPVGSLAALKLHLRRPDRDTLEAAYPLLSAWSRWWVAERDGRPRRAPGPRELLTWGSDLDRIDSQAPPWERDAGIRQLAAWESGQDDLPTWDEAEPVAGHGCLDVDPVDLNAYRVLDLECLARIAGELGRDEEAEGHRRAADRLRRLVNEHLWDPDRETYADRRWDGAFTACRTASHFLVLAAGIPPADRARRMVEHLTDPSLFWGDRVVPTISRSDPRFAEQQYWRGTIWPPINYLVHMGLARYGFDGQAAAVAERGARMFLEDRRRTGLCRENFDSRTGEGGGQRHQSWGPLFALAALEELADVTPWDGLRLGGLAGAGETAVTNLDLGPRGRFAVTTGGAGLRIAVDGRPVLESSGAAVLREVEAAPDRLAAVVSSEAPVVLRYHLPGARWTVSVDGRREELTEPVIRLEAGRRRLEVRCDPGGSAPPSGPP